MDKIVNKITAIGCSLVGKEGYAVTLTANGTVSLCITGYEEPYGIVVKGCDSVTPGVYPSAVVDGALEILSEVGQCVMVRISGEYSLTCNSWLAASCGVEPSESDSQFYAPLSVQCGYRIWGVALTDAKPTDDWCMMRFQPMYAFREVT